MRAFLLNNPQVSFGPYYRRMNQSASNIYPNWTWPNFSSAEMACPHCGEGYYWPEFMDSLQMARTEAGRAFKITSAHRCSLHNARVGGAPLSQHLKLAADIALSEHDLARLYEACKRSGFTGFGFYTSFLHVDLGRPRHWFGNIHARRLWQTFLD